MAKTKYLVGLAEVASRYGGPEEGGWYYEAGEPVGPYTVFFNREKALSFRDHLRESIEDGAAFRGVGVGGCGDDDGMMIGEHAGGGLAVEVQTYPEKYRGGMRSWPEYRPRYE